jgi:iron complex outermembrane receptor protein
MSFTLSYSQVSGVVTSKADGEPLIGVNVVVKGKETKVGAITDFNGSYIVNAMGSDTLVVSYIGFNTMEIPVDNRSVIDIQMAEQGELLDEVVVVGYGAARKKDLTGVVSKVNDEEFNRGSLASPESLINGKVAGLQIKSNGEPGGKTQLRLRGGTSLDASSDPLIVIDGVPIDNRDVASQRNPLNFVNAANVESITVLKDASAAAIYGSRGANGVVIITTKSGQSGRPTISYNGNANMSVLGATPDNLSPSLFRDAIFAKAPQEFEFLGENNTDWVDEVTQNAFSQEHNLSVSGGNDRFKYLVSGGLLASNGVLKTSKHQNQSVTANLRGNFFNNTLKVNIQSKTAFTEDVFAPNVLGAALAMDPTRPVLDPNSRFGGYWQWRDPLATNNPVSTLELTDETGTSTRSLNSLSLEYNLPFFSDLTLYSNLSYDYISGDKRKYQDPFLKDGTVFERGGYLFNEDLRNYTGVIESFATYRKKLESINSSLDFTFGHSWQETDQENFWEEGNRLMDVDGELTYTEDIRQDSFLVQNRLISFFGRMNFNLREKYLFTGSLRRDGSSRFGEGNKWGLFPAAAVAWRVLEEDFAFPLRRVFTDLKLRVSWGVTGNEDIEDFLFTTFYAFGTDDARYQFGSEFVRTLRGQGVDPNIKWEETRSTNIGIDFGFWNNRVSGSLELYDKYTDDLLFTVATSAFTNLSDRILTNIGEMENRGVELSINTVVLDKSDWNWDIGFNVAHNQNQIVKLDNSNLPDFQGYETGGISGDVGQNIQVLKVGESIETFNTFKHILDDAGNPRVDTRDWNGDGFINDLDIYEDINGDGLINENDLVTGENAAPDIILGLTSNLRYKNWSLSATFRSHIGNHVYNNVASSTGFFERLTDRVTNNVDESAFTTNFQKRQLRSDYYVEDASFVRLDNITVGYNFTPNNIFRNLSLFVTATNVFVLTQYSGLDPELPQFNGGIDNNIYPVSRNFLIGVKADF